MQFKINFENDPNREKYQIKYEESLIEDNIFRGNDVVILLPSFYYNCNNVK